MNLNNIFELIDRLNENNIVDIQLYIIYHDENIIYNEYDNLDEFKKIIKDNNIKENELIYEFIIKYHNDKKYECIENINEFDDLEINYICIDEFDYNEFYNDVIIEIFNDDDEIDEIIKKLNC